MEMLPMRSDIQRGVISRSAPKHLQPSITPNPHSCSIEQQNELVGNAQTNT